MIPLEPTVYKLTQRLRLATQETHDTPTIESESERSGLVLVRPWVDGLRWRREIEEQILTDGDLRWLRAETRRPRAQVRERSAAARLLRDPPWGLGSRLTITSDLRGRDPVLPVEGGMVPYAISAAPMPVPYESLCWPTLTPVLPAADGDGPEPGAVWDGVIRFQCGAGNFEMTYANTLLETTLTTHRIEVRPTPALSASPAEGVTLVATTGGGWTVVVMREGGAWREACGRFELAVRAQLKLFGEDLDIEVLRVAQSFDVERVPVTFDDQQMYAAAWAMQIEREETERDSRAEDQAEP